MNALALFARAAGARTRLRRLASLIASERLRDSLVPRPDRRVENTATAVTAHAATPAHGTASPRS